MTEKINPEHKKIEDVFSQTYVFDKVPRTFKETLKFIKEQFPQYTLDGWCSTYQNYLQRFRNEDISHVDLPKVQQQEFVTSLKIDAFAYTLTDAIQEAVSPTKPFLENYKQCEKPEFINAKNALEENLEPLISHHKNERPAEFRKRFFEIKSLKDYFSSFIFDMKHHHSGELEYTIEKQIKFPTSIEDRNTVFFSFFECVAFAFSKVIRDENGKITNKDEIIKNIFVPDMSIKCFLCDTDNIITFNHKEGLIQEAFDEICPIYQKGADTSTISSKITTNGKLIFINDVRSIAKKISEIEDGIQRFGVDNNISTYINVWQGQNGFMNIYAQLFNVGYIQAGNHGANLKVIPNGLKVTYYNQENNAVANISLELWAASFIDYDKAVQLAGGENKLIEKLNLVEHHIIDVKPGTYKVINHLNNTEDMACEPEFDDIDLAFGELVWLNDNIQLAPLTTEEWDFLK